MNLILIRHAESHANVDSKVYRTQLHSTIELTEKGKLQAKVAGQTLQQTFITTIKSNRDSKFSIYVSPYIRTRQTYQEISPYISDYTSKTTVRYDATIHEHVCGSNIEEVERIVYDSKFKNFWYKEPGTESWADVYARAKNFLTSLQVAHLNDPNATIIVISHVGFLATLEGIILNQNPETAYLDNNFDNAEIKFYSLGL